MALETFHYDVTGNSTGSIPAVFSGDSMTYVVQCPSGNTILEGIVTRYPDGRAVTVNVPSMVAPFLKKEYNSATGLTTEDEAMKVFYYIPSTGNSRQWTIMEAMRDPKLGAYTNGKNAILNDPIKKEVPAGVIIPLTAVVITPGTITIKVE